MPKKLLIKGKLVCLTNCLINQLKLEMNKNCSIYFKVSVDHQQSRFDAEQRRIVHSDSRIRSSSGSSEISDRKPERGVDDVHHGDVSGDDDANEEKEGPASSTPSNPSQEGPS